MDVTIVPHDPAWAAAFAGEARAVAAALPGIVVGVHHIGSTAIAGILAKPVLDILCLVTSLAALDGNADRLEALGYVAKGANGIEGRRFFRKADPAGRRTHHLHAFEPASRQVQRHLAFRDYMNSHPAKAAAYSALKAGLIAAGAVTREAYQSGKDAFVDAAAAEALAWSLRTRGAEP